MLKEIDIAKPVEQFFEDLGYIVRSEVKGCDITATKNDKLLVIECKKSASLKLIYQAVDRQEFCDNVYIAIPLVHGKKIPNRKDLSKLLKRLEIGFIIVTFLKTKTNVEVVFDPKEHKKKHKLKHKASVLKEISERSANYNVGGSVRTKIMTAYKEHSLEIAALLKEHGSMSTPKLKELGASSKTYTILYKNYYGWFFKDIGCGVYGVTQKGLAAINNYRLP